MSGKAALIVEDNREISDMLSAFLRESGWESPVLTGGGKTATLSFIVIVFTKTSEGGYRHESVCGDTDGKKFRGGICRRISGEK